MVTYIILSVLGILILIAAGYLIYVNIRRSIRQRSPRVKKIPAQQITPAPVPAPTSAVTTKVTTRKSYELVWVVTLVMLGVGVGVGYKTFLSPEKRAQLHERIMTTDTTYTLVALQGQPVYETLPRNWCADLWGEYDRDILWRGQTMIIVLRPKKGEEKAEIKIRKYKVPAGAQC